MEFGYRKKGMITYLEVNKEFDGYIIFRIGDERYRCNNIGELTKTFGLYSFYELRGADFKIKNIYLEENNSIRLMIEFLIKNNKKNVLLKGNKI